MHSLLEILEIISLLVIVVVVIIGVVKLVVRTTASEHNHALDAAKERYARGEIAKEEFDQLKKDLR